MDAKEAIKFLQDNLDSRPVSEGYIGVSFWRTELEEVIKALRKRLEWQPMETCPLDTRVILIQHDSGDVRDGMLRAGWVNLFDDCHWGVGDFYGWMPLPEVE